jgi:hypothetical protein
VQGSLGDVLEVEADAHLDGWNVKRGELGDLQLRLAGPARLERNAPDPVGVGGLVLELEALRRARWPDRLGDRRVSWLWSAAYVVGVTGWPAIPGTAGSLVAAAGFAVAGVLCVGNALRCRRAHCTITGPLYLVAALLFVARAGA